MGPVFRAYDAEHERLVAIKLFKLDLPPERVHQLVAEFEQLIAADLTHPGFARPLATGISGVTAYLAQEYVAAESLDLAVREYGAAPAADALRVAAQVAGALDFAAIVDIHHGALHPRDVLLSAEDTRLTGTGVAQALQKIGVSVPVRRPYTAPEIVTGDLSRRGVGGPKADLFSLAAVVYELLTSKRVAGPGDAAAETLGDVAGADPAALRRVFARALAERPGDRFDTALEFVEALKQAFPESTVITRPAPAKSRPKLDDHRAEAAPLLPLDAPEPTDRADVEMPIAPQMPAVSEEPVFREPTVPDLPLAAAEEQRYEDVEVGAHLAAAEDREAVAPVSAVAHPEPFSSVIETSRSAVWPLLLALIVGVAVGFAAGYGVGGHDRTIASAPPSGGKEFTETAVKPDQDLKPAPEIRLKPDTTVAGLKPDTTAVAAPEPRATSHQPPAPAPPVPAPPVTDLGRLLVRSTPSGARVTVDGKDAGNTPAVVRELAPGAHRVHVMRDGYAAMDERVTITRSRPAQTLTVALERERTASRGTAGGFNGSLFVDSRPSGAKVFVDGKLIGTTPLSLPSVAAGEHAVRLEYDGYRRWTSSVRVVATEQNRVTASLER